MTVDLPNTAVFNTQCFYQVLFVFVDPASACVHRLEVSCVAKILKEHIGDGGSTAHLHVLQSPKSRININSESL
jgi:hypothetical protein